MNGKAQKRPLGFRTFRQRIRWSKYGDYSCARAIVALEVIAEFVHGNPISEEELTQKIRRVPGDVSAMLVAKLARMKA